MIPAGLEAWRVNVRASYRQFARVPQADLAWVTVVAGARAIGSGDSLEWVPAFMSEYRTSLRAGLMASGNLRRGTRWRGVMEFDLLHPRLYSLGKAKNQLLSSFGIDAATIPSSQRIIVPHAHMIVDCRGHGGLEGLKDALHTCYPLPRQVMVKPLHDGPVSENLDRLADYSTKFRLQYSMAWDGRATKYMAGTTYEQEWKSLVYRLVSEQGWDNISFRSVA